MQNGAPANNAKSIMTFLKEKFPRHRVGTKSDGLSWPARLADLQPLDLFFGDI